MPRSTTKPTRSPKKTAPARPVKSSGAKKAAPKNSVSPLHPAMTDDDKERMIQYAAYHIAEKDGFQAGKEKDYWFRAERQIQDLIEGQTRSDSYKSH
jgi:hypothetical protein